jgi:hypothetical protein
MKAERVRLGIWDRMGTIGDALRVRSSPTTHGNRSKLR